MMRLPNMESRMRDVEQKLYRLQEAVEGLLMFGGGQCDEVAVLAQRILRALNLPTANPYPEKEET